MIDLITRHFNLEELRTLCFELGIPFEELGSGGLSSVARELLLYAQRRNGLPQLLAALEAARPSVAWPEATELSLTPGQTVDEPPGSQHAGRDSIVVGNITDSAAALGQGASVVVGKLPRRKKRKGDRR